MENTCLVIIFNHRYNNNICKLRKIYGERFSKILFLVPFYQGEEEDVIPVYESSYEFSGYLIQAYPKLMECDADFFLFLGDDCILNPIVNEKNVVSEFQLSDKELFIPSVVRLNCQGNFSWIHARRAPEAFVSKAVEWKRELPEYREALERFGKFFKCKIDEEYTDSFFSGKLKNEDEATHFKAISEFLRLNGNSRNIIYPLAWGYVDIFIIKRTRLFSLARVNGIFSAMNLFVEIAFPTSVVIEFLRENVCMLNDLENYSCKVVWSREEKEKLQRNYKSIEDLMKEWHENILFMHPIKLSILKY